VVLAQGKTQCDLGSASFSLGESRLEWWIQSDVDIVTPS
jgi:hypothetical protein